MTFHRLFLVRRSRGAASLFVVLSAIWALPVHSAAPDRWNVREQGAVGDGATLDTAAINRALAACANAGGGEVWFPPGRYLSGTVHLRSHMTLSLGPGARLIGTTNLSEYAQPTPPDFMPEAKWGKWHRGLLVGQDVEDVTICGPGTIDGNKVFDPTGEERMRGPHTIIFVNCRRFTIRDLTITDAANYAVYFEVSDDVDLRNVKIVGGWDGIHWRGAPERWCKNVSIIGCQCYTGDDCIAGRYWEHTVISDCILNSSCNGLRLIGPATGLIINDCLLYGPGLQPHRTSGEKRRTNMLSGINLQPGAWDATRGALDDVLLSRITMQNVAAPLTLWTKPGNTVGRVTVTDVSATGVYRSALSIESWAGTLIGNVVLRNCQFEFVGGGTREQAARPVLGPGVDARPLPAWGLYARHIQKLTIEDVRLSLVEPDLRPALIADEVRELNIDNFKFSNIAGLTQPIVLTNVTTLNWNERPHNVTAAPP